MIAAALLAAALLLGGCSRPADSAGAAAERVYGSLIANRVSGAPGESQLAALAPDISDTLRVLLAAASRLRAEEARRYPDEKPAFAEGDLFSSLFEGATSFRVVGTQGGPRQRVMIELTHERGEPVTWTDVVIAVRERGRWVVDDVEYQGGWDFAPRGTLRQALEQALAN